MKCAIMQPTFIPWAGYFNLISSVDLFVFLDDVQLERQSWQTRNRILVQNRDHYVIVPVGNNRLDQTIFETKIIDLGWNSKVIKKITFNYQKHPFFHELVELIDFFDEAKKKADNNLALFNEFIIMFIMQKIGISKEIAFSREITSNKRRTERLIEICQKFSVQTYLSPVGAKSYLEEDSFVEKSGMKLEFQNFLPNFYPQRKASNFISHLSIVDVIANMGWDATRSYIHSGQESYYDKN